MGHKHADHTVKLAYRCWDCGKRHRICTRCGMMRTRHRGHCPATT